MPKKDFRIPAAEIKPLVENNEACFATDAIVVEGRRVGYMYREPPDKDVDSGWRFMAGDESDEYMDDSSNLGIYSVNTVANYDPEIIPLLDAPIGSAFARDSESGAFVAVKSPIDPDKCLHPDFPVVTGRYQLTETWAVVLPLRFNRRLEEGSLVLWRPGVTIYLSAWGNDRGESIDARLSWMKAEASPEAFEANEQEGRSVRWFSYRLVEDGVNALYGFAIADGGHMQVAIYFDDETDIDLARSIFTSITTEAAG